MSQAKPNALSKVDRIRPAYAQVASQLREIILGGELSPGDRLPNENEMAAQFGVSRTTVREALRVLTSQGLLRTERGVTGGTFVSKADPGRVVELLETGLNVLAVDEGLSVFELIECRELLEVPAARLAAARRTEADLEILEQLVSAEKAENQGFEEVFETRRQFHLAIVKAARNRMLTVVLEPIFNVLSNFAPQVHADERARDEVPDDHGDLLAAIRESDADRAAETMMSHLAHLKAAYSVVQPAPTN